MERLGLKKSNALIVGADNLIRNVRYRKINLVNNNARNRGERNINEENLLKSDTVEQKYNEESMLEYENIEQKNNEKSMLRNENKKQKYSKENKENLEVELEHKRLKKKSKKNKFNLSNNKSEKKFKKKFIIFLVIVAIPIIIFEFFTIMIEPSLIAMCEIRANSIGVTVSSKAVKQVMEEVGYDVELINLEKDSEGNIIALKANVIEMNYIASLIGSRTQQMYNELSETYVQIPIGNFTGNALLASRGPRIKVKIMPVGTVGSDFKTEFVSSGINQTRHRVYLQVVSSMRVIAPFSTKTIKVVNNVNVAETVLIGNVPNSYYNLEGLDNMADDSLNLWDE